MMGPLGAVRGTASPIIWGDTMNVASRLQAVAPLNGIAVSEATYFQTMAIQAFEAHKVVLKGIGGETAAYAARLDAREGEK
jgi:class 3 adenylate cyclase